MYQYKLQRDHWGKNKRAQTWWIGPQYWGGCHSAEKYYRRFYTCSLDTTIRKLVFSLKVTPTTCDSSISPFTLGWCLRYGNYRRPSQVLELERCFKNCLSIAFHSHSLSSELMKQKAMWGIQFDILSVFLVLQLIHGWESHYPIASRKMETIHFRQIPPVLL